MRSVSPAHDASSTSTSLPLHNNRKIQSNADCRTGGEKGREKELDFIVWRNLLVRPGLVRFPCRDDTSILVYLIKRELDTHNLEHYLISSDNQSSRKLKINYTYLLRRRLQRVGLLIDRRSRPLAWLICSMAKRFKKSFFFQKIWGKFLAEESKKKFPWIARLCC